MQVSQNYEIEIRRLVRDAYAIDPLITWRKICDLVEKKTGRKISHQYLNRIIKKVHGETAVRIDKERIEPRLQQMRETFRIAKENLVRIASGQTNPGELSPLPKDKIAAWKAIAYIDKILVDVEMDLGIYDRKIGTVDIQHRIRPVDESTRQAILASFDNWAVAPEGRKIEAREVKKQKPIDVPFEVKNAEPDTKSKQPIPVVAGSPVVSG